MNNTIYPFSVVDYPSNGKLFGKYYATKPLIAAKKAFKKLAQKYNIINTNNKFLSFTLKNIKNKKEYKYIGTRIQLVNPKIIYKNGIKHTYYFLDIVSKYKNTLNGGYYFTPLTSSCDKYVQLYNAFHI